MVYLFLEKLLYELVFGSSMIMQSFGFLLQNMGVFAGFLEKLLCGLSKNCFEKKYCEKTESPLLEQL